MRINNGLFESMVLQRTGRNTCEVLIDGEAPVDGALTATVRSAGRVLKDWRARRVGRVVRTRLTGTLKGLPVGGPYEIELRVAGRGGVDDSLRVCDVWVGDVWLAAGQSNMCGTGGDAMPSPPLPHVRAFYPDDTWRPAVDPIHHHYRCVDSIHRQLNGFDVNDPAQPQGPGTALMFARTLFEKTGIPQGVIACAHGGTAMEQWSPDIPYQDGSTLFGALVRRLKKNGGRVAGMIWYQGEGEADAVRPRVYVERMQRLIERIREEASAPRMPVVIAQLCRFVVDGDGGAWNQIRELQRTLDERILHLSCVPTIDLTLGDLIHLDGKANITLGRRMADAMMSLRGDAGCNPDVIRLRKVSWEPGWAHVVVKVDFDHVVGRLIARDRPVGFSVRDAKGVNQAYAVDLDGSSARIRLSASPETIESHHLYYGCGMDPVCNIQDEAGRSLPAFGPISIPGPRAVTPFVRALRVSRFVRRDKGLDGLACPARVRDLNLQTLVFDGGFCNVNEELSKCGAQNGLVWFACDLLCPESMSFDALLGYDGPIRLWWDGREIFDDPSGACPARPDKSRVPIKADKGRHELMIALGGNCGKAWGIFLRFERRAKGRGLALPTVLG